MREQSVRYALQTGLAKAPEEKFLSNTVERVPKSRIEVSQSRVFLTESRETIDQQVHSVKMIHSSILYLKSSGKKKKNTVLAYDSRVDKSLDLG